jgi:magnesium-transporting ATPase (P-type)
MSLQAVQQKEKEERELKHSGKIDEATLLLTDEKVFSWLGIISYICLIVTTGGFYVMRHVTYQDIKTFMRAPFQATKSHFVNLVRSFQPRVWKWSVSEKFLERFFTIVLFIVWVLLLISEGLRYHVLRAKDEIVEEKRRENMQRNNNRFI